MFTAIQLHYQRLKTEKDKGKFKRKIMHDSGISESTFYRILQNEPGKLLKNILSEATGIEATELYKTIDPVLTTKKTITK